MTTKTPPHPSVKNTLAGERAAPASALGPNVDGITIGIDLGDKKHAICVIDADGETIDARKITNHRESLRRLSKKFPTARMVMEVGSHSPWISRFLRDLAHEIIAANARKLRSIPACCIPSPTRVNKLLLAKAVHRRSTRGDLVLGEGAT